MFTAVLAVVTVVVVVVVVVIIVVPVKLQFTVYSKFSVGLANLSIGI